MNNPVVLPSSLDSVAANRFDAYEISRDPLSDRTRCQFAHWIDTCKKNHTRCTVGGKSLPKRVIDVRTDQLKLLDPSPTGSHQYVALSHCWGTCREFLTTRETLEVHRAGFALDDLPATFRDAVIATRALYIPFLWIDSICIIQGDKEDWELEGSKLADIYSDATVTICASNATDDAEGFLRTRQRPPTATIDIICPSLLGGNGAERATRFYVHSAHDARARKDYLAERAWCLQERYLSPRIISFEQDCINWECLEATWSETWRKGRSTGESLFKDRDDDKQLYKKWPKMVEHYSRRSLTYTSDTLPALSAVAKRAAQATGDKYLAGLWGNDLLRWLLWHGVRYAGGYNRAEVHARSHTYHAPSWSWASYPGSVAFQAPPSETKYQLFESVTFVEATANAEGKNPFGAVQTAVLILRTPILPVVPISHIEDPPEKQWEGYQSNILSCSAFGIANKDFKVMLDYPTDKVEGRVFALPLAHHGGAIYSKYHVAAGTLEEGASETAVRNLAIVYGLLVTETAGGEGGSYQRIGIFHMDWTPLDIFLKKLTQTQQHLLKVL
jgi:hypothetical protein